MVNYTSHLALDSVEFGPEIEIIDDGMKQGEQGQNKGGGCQYLPRHLRKSDPVPRIGRRSRDEM